MLLFMKFPYKRWVKMIHRLVDFCQEFLQVSNMYTKTATAREQCFEGTFVFFIEDLQRNMVPSTNTTFIFKFTKPKINFF